jgi:hypothetical protein
MMIETSAANGWDDLGLWIGRALRAEVEDCCPSEQVWQRIARRVLSETPAELAVQDGRSGGFVARFRPALTAVCVFELSCFVLWWKAAFVL